MSLADTDPVLATLWLPFAEGLVSAPTEPVLFLNARAPLSTHLLNHLPDSSLWHCLQPFKPDADALQRTGLSVHDDLAPVLSKKPDAGFAMTLVLPPRQREHARALLAHAVTHTRVGGTVLSAASNNEGARSIENDLAALLGTVQSFSKHKCRASFAQIDPTHINQTLINEWLRLDAIRPINHPPFVSRPGVFAWDHIDSASQLLAAQLPASLRGRAADLGTGLGYLTLELLQRCPGITQVDAYEADARALALAQLNIEAATADSALNRSQRVRYHWHDVTQGLTSIDPKPYDVIVTNPPFHALTRHDRPDIGQQFIRVAAAALRSRGELFLVANRHLPYEALLHDRFAQVRVAAQAQGFKIIHALKA